MIMDKIAILYNEQTNRIKYIVDVIKDEYEIIHVHSLNEVKTLLDNSFTSLITLIIDHPSDKPYINALLKDIEERNSYMFTLPVLLLTHYTMVEEDDKFLSDVAVGMITEGESKNTVLRRIKSANKLSNSASFDDFSKMLTALPSLIYLKDKNGRYAFCSQDWHHSKYPNQSIRGLTDFDMRKSKENARIAREADMKVISSGRGSNYVIKEEDDEGIDYLQIIKEPVKNEKGEVTGIIAIVNNVTDSELLKQELRKKSITDPLTELYNRYYYEELEAEYKNKMTIPITVISADCDGLKRINDKYGHAAGDKYICFARDAIQESLPEKSYLFRMGGDEFVAVIPGMKSYDAAILTKEIVKNSKKYKNGNFALKLSVGHYTIAKPGITLETAVALSDKAMYKMKKKHLKIK